MCKWEHTSKKGNLLIRLFYKSSHPAYQELIGMSEEDLLQVALSDISKSLNLQLNPVVSEVTKWSESMPNYLITHPKNVSALEEKLTEAYPGDFLAGCSYYGVEIPDCMGNGIKTAQKITALL
ncbi:FAD-dependent oxidoreductase [Cytobacillus sp. Hz8]|uniref:FAD-dependent oxidoreductase n=1 Tax=Cytobacillus sp. Hz8 TaxID=3347168 RepID=UPI0035E3BB2C